MVGCNQTAKNPKAGTPSDKKPVVSQGPPTHRMDLEGVAIPDVPLVAHINGKTVKFHRVEATTAKEGGDRATGLNFNVGGKILSVRLPSSLVVHSDKKWEILKPTKKTEDYKHLMVGIPGKHYYSGFVMRLALGKAADGKLPGRIYLCLPDDEKSFIAGKFEAEILP